MSQLHTPWIARSVELGGTLWAVVDQRGKRIALVDNADGQGEGRAKLMAASADLKAVLQEVEQTTPIAEPSLVVRVIESLRKSHL